MRIVEITNSIATKHLLFYWLPVYAYAGLIFYLSSLPTIPEPIAKTFADWVLHMIEYGILGVLLLRAFGKSDIVALKNQAVIMAIVVATVYGITDEIHQFFVPGRVMSGFDALANFVGSVVAVAAIAIVQAKTGAKFGAKLGARFKSSKLHF